MAMAKMIVGIAMMNAMSVRVLSGGEEVGWDCEGEAVIIGEEENDGEFVGKGRDPEMAINPFFSNLSLPAALVTVRETLYVPADE